MAADDKEKSSQTGSGGGFPPGRYSDPGDKGRLYPKKGADQSASLSNDFNPQKGPHPKEA